MTMIARRRNGGRMLLVALWLSSMAGHAMAMASCVFDPVTRTLTVEGLEGPSAPAVLPGKGGIGGTGKPVTGVKTETGPSIVLGATGKGGIGGTGAPSANTGKGGIGGTGIPVRAAFAGKILFANGTVFASRDDGSRRALGNGTPVCSGDTIETAASSMVQLSMADGGKIDIGADSHLHLDAFVMPPDMDGSELFSATLERGSIRASTGMIGHLHKSRYTLHTPLSDIGIRGTVHEVFHVPDALPGIPAGTYNRVLSGGTVLISAGQQLELSSKETGYVASMGDTPLRLPSLPEGLSRFSVSVPLQASPADKEKPARMEHPADAGPPVYLQALDIIRADHAESVAAPEGSALVGVGHDIENDALDVGGVIHRTRNGSLIVLDPDWGIPDAATDTMNGFNLMIRGDSPLYDLGYATVDGVNVIWGLYGATSSVDRETGEEKSVDFHHFAFASGGATPSAVLSGLSGTVNFNQLIGSTMPSTGNGTVGGQVNALSIGVTLGPETTITAYRLDVTDGQSRNWTAQFNGAISLPSFRAGQMVLSTQCSGNNCGNGTGSGNASGIIIGNQGKGIITSYGLNAGPGTSVSGAAVVSRP